MASQQPPQPARQRVKTSALLPIGATLSVAAIGLHVFTGESTPLARIMAVVAALAALAAWLFITRQHTALGSLGMRFLSILAIALAITGMIVTRDDWLSTLGVMGLWIAVGGAAIEWRRGRARNRES